LNLKVKPRKYPGLRRELEMKVLITGGAGFIGSRVALKLSEKGYEVVIYDVGVWDAKLNHTEYIKGDIFDIGHLTATVKQCDVVIHMIGLADAKTAQSYPQMSFDLNIRSLQVVLESMRSNGVTRLILPSSAAIYGAVDKSPITEETVPKLSGVYPYHKYIAERLAETYSLNYGIHITILRLFNVYGIKGQGILNILIEKATKGEPVKLYGQKQKRDFIHVSDVADVFANVLELDHRFEVYNVGTGVGRTIEDVTKIVKEYFPALIIQFGEYNGILYDSVANIVKLQQATGFNPDVSDYKLRKFIQNRIYQQNNNIITTVFD
jgi:nucleoside-diphosphate-sugar epimerase